MVGIDGREFVLADIPGLIEGAHQGAGLGDRFLGHVERCRVLLHLVDGTGEDAGKAYDTVRAELEAYGHGLRDKPEIVALNKSDALAADELKRQLARLSRAVARNRNAGKTGGAVLVISAVTGAGVPQALRAILAEIDAADLPREQKRCSRAVGALTHPDYRPRAAKSTRNRCASMAMAPRRERMLNNAVMRHWLSHAAGR